MICRKKKVGPTNHVSPTGNFFCFLLSLHFNSRIANDGHRNTHALLVDGQ